MLNRTSEKDFVAGEKLFLGTGSVFKGKLILNATGTKEKPVVVTSYDTDETGLPVIDAKDFFGNPVTGNLIWVLLNSNKLRLVEIIRASSYYFMFHWLLFGYKRYTRCLTNWGFISFIFYNHKSKAK